MMNPSRAERYITIETPSRRTVHIGVDCVYGPTLFLALGVDEETAFDISYEQLNRVYNITQAIIICEKSDHEDAKWLAEEIRKQSEAMEE